MKKLFFLVQVLLVPLLIGCGQGKMASYTFSAKEYFHNYVNNVAPGTYGYSAANNPEDKIVSSAYLYKGVTNSDVDVRTGQFNISFPVAHLSANSLGSDFVLNVNYSSGMPFDKNNPYSVAKNWSFSLPYIDVNNKILHTSSGQVLHYKSDELKGKQKFDYYKLNDIIFNVTDIDHSTKKLTNATVIYSDDHSEEFSTSDAIPYAVLQKISYTNGYWVSFVYQGIKLVKITDAYNNIVTFEDNKIYSKLADKDYAAILGKGGFGSYVTLNYIAFNDESKKVRFNYESENDGVYGGLLKGIDSPTGSSTRLTYGLMAALSPQGSTVPLPVIIKKEIFPSAEDADVVEREPSRTHYIYGNNQVNGVFQGRNYTGYPNFNYADNSYSEMPNNFLYSTTVSVTQPTGERQNTTYYFNHLNLLLKEISYVGSNLADPEGVENKLISQKNMSYCDSVKPDSDVNKNEQNHIDYNCDVYVKDLNSNYSQARHISETLYSSQDRTKNITSLTSFTYNPFGLVLTSANNLNNAKQNIFYTQNINGMSVVPYISQRIFPHDGSMTEVKEVKKLSANIPGVSGKRTEFLATTKKVTYFNPNDNAKGLQVKGGIKKQIKDAQGNVIDNAYPLFEAEQQWTGCDANGYAFLCSEKSGYSTGSPVDSLSIEGNLSEFNYEFSSDYKFFSIAVKKYAGPSHSELSLSKKTDFDTASGLALQETFPNGNSKVMVYDNYGRNLNVRVLDANKNIISNHSYEYDNEAYRWIFSKNEKSGLQTRYLIDSLGRDYAVLSNKGTENLLERRRVYYNNLGQVVKTVVPFGKDGSVNVEFSYDNLGRVLQEKSSTGISSNYIYNDLWFDEQNRPVQLVAKYATAAMVDDRDNSPPLSITKKDLLTQKVTGAYVVKNNKEPKDYKSLEYLVNSDAVIDKKEMIYNDLDALIKETGFTPNSKTVQSGNLISLNYFYDLKGDLVRKEFPSVRNLVISGVPQNQNLAINFFLKHDIAANLVCLGLGLNESDNVCE